MKFTIVVDDGFVSVDGEGYNGIDLSELAAENIHAVQFYGEYGEAEFKPVFNAETRQLTKPVNEVFDAKYVYVFQTVIDRWEAAKEQARIAAEVREKAIAEAMAAQEEAAAAAQVQTVTVG